MSTIRLSSKKNLAIIELTLVIICLSVLFFWRALIPGQTFIADTLFRYNYPQHHLIKETLAKGVLPLWNPFLSCGISFVADPQTSLFYPLTYVHSFLDFASAIKIIVIIHTILAGLFMGKLAESLGLDSRSALLSGILYAFNGFSIFHYQLPGHLQVYAWIPLGLLLLRRALGSFSALSWASSSLILALLILAGYVPFVIYALTLFFIFTLMTSQGHRWKLISKFFLIVMTALGIAAVQIGPTLEFALRSDRAAGLGLDWALSKSLSWRSATKMLFCPLWSWYCHFDSDLGITGLYWGILPLILALLALVRLHKNNLCRTLFIMLGLSFVLAAGKNGFFYPILASHVWPFTWLRYPANALILANFSMALLVGLGLQSIKIKWQSYWIIFCVLDLWIFAQKAYQTIPSSFYKEIPPTVRFLKSQESGRIFMSPMSAQILYRHGKTKYEAYLNFADSLIPDYAVPFHLSDAGGGYLQYQKYKPIQNALSQSPTSPWLNVLSARYLLSFFDIPSLEKVWTGPSGIQVFVNKSALPRAYFISHAVVRTYAETLRDITDGDLTPRKNVVLNESPVKYLSQTNDLLWMPLSPRDISPNRVLVQVDAPAPGWVVFTDTYDSGWRVWANGTTVRLFRANCVQRAVHVEAGQTVLDWRYQPITWNFSVLVSLLTLMTMIILIRMNRPPKRS